jgi:hypothetical protein
LPLFDRKISHSVFADPTNHRKSYFSTRSNTTMC